MNNLHNLEIWDGYTQDNQYYKGIIEKRKLSSTLEYFRFQFVGLHDFKIDLKLEKDAALYLYINLADASPKINTRQDLNFDFPAFSNLLMQDVDSETKTLIFSKAKNYNFIVLRIAKVEFDEEHLSMDQLLEHQNQSVNFREKNLRTAPNLAMCEIARTLVGLDKCTPDQKFIAKGYASILIGLKIKEVLQLEQTAIKTMPLRNFEIQQLENLISTIKLNPQHPYTIKMMCKETGLSVSKLQIGFKEMHNCTVAIFIRNMRLEKALDMLRYSDLNISEIVYSIGLTSRSYFCRIFKRRFKCSPKFYQQQLRSSSVLAS